VLVLCTEDILAQKYKSVKSFVEFYSDAPMEDIKAQNAEAGSVFDVASGGIAFSVPIKGFQFEKALMQEHFNEKYMESDQYPRATFKGQVKGYDKNTEGPQKATASGTMKIHGVEKHVEINGEITFREDEIIIEAKFPVTVEDYKIKIPRVVFYNIAEVVDVTIKFRYEKM